MFWVLKREGKITILQYFFGCNYEHFSKKKYFLFKSFVKVELSCVFTIKMLKAAENYMEKWIILLKQVYFLLLVIIYVPPIILDRWLFNIK